MRSRKSEVCLKDIEQLCKSDMCFEDTEQLARTQLNTTGNDKRISWNLWLDVTQSHFKSEICFEDVSYITNDV